jgi:hypothetical protein
MSDERRRNYVMEVTSVFSRRIKIVHRDLVVPLSLNPRPGVPEVNIFLFSAKIKKIVEEE